MRTTLQPTVAERLRPRDVILPLAAGVLVWPPLQWFVGVVADPTRIGLSASAVLTFAFLVIVPVVSAGLAVLILPLVHRQRLLLAVTLGTVPTLVVALVRLATVYDQVERLSGRGALLVVASVVMIAAALVTSWVVSILTVRSARREGLLG